MMYRYTPCTSQPQFEALESEAAQIVGGPNADAATVLGNGYYPVPEGHSAYAGASDTPPAAPAPYRYVAIIPPLLGTPQLLYINTPAQPTGGADVWEDVSVGRMLASAETEYGRDYAAPFLQAVQDIAMLPTPDRWWLASVQNGVLGYPVEVPADVEVPPGYVLSEYPHRWHKRTELDTTHLLQWEADKPWLNL